MKYFITIRRERELWLEFVHKAKKEKKKIRDVLSPYLKKYIASDGEARVLLLLFPRNLLDELVEKENPEEFIEGAVQKYLARQKVDYSVG
jgi:hypothetical protein